MVVSQRVGAANSSPKGSASRGRADEETSDWEDARTHEKSPEAACAASSSRQAAGFEVQGAYCARKAGYCAQGHSPFRTRCWRNEVAARLRFWSSTTQDREEDGSRSCRHPQGAQSGRSDSKETRAHPRPVCAAHWGNPALSIHLGARRRNQRCFSPTRQRNGPFGRRAQEIDEGGLHPPLARFTQRGTRWDQSNRSDGTGRGWPRLALRVSLGIGDSPLAIRHVKGNNHGAFQVGPVADNAATANGAIHPLRPTRMAQKLGSTFGC
jgi:hypothetical protein